MKGAIIGDVVGSSYEFARSKVYDFVLFPENSRFTDDTVLTLATADVLLTKGTYAQTYYLYAQKYRDVAWGGLFYKWAFHSENPGEPYNSFGNGSAMRVAPIGWFFPTIEETLVEARNSAMVTHNH